LFYANFEGDGDIRFSKDDADFAVGVHPTDRRMEFRGTSVIGENLNHKFMVGGVERFHEVGEHDECRMELKILDPRSMRVTPLHLLGSLRSQLLGTGTT